MFETTIAGSLPKPFWLAETDKLWPAWKATGADLEKAKRDATLLWLKEQEDAGLDIVTDGEQSRQHFVHGFLESVEGIDFEHKVKLAMAFAALLNQEARALEKDGVDVIQFDEPAFNVYMPVAAEWGVAALERAAEGLKCKTAVHICYGYGIKANVAWKGTLGNEWRQYEQVFPALAKSSIDQVSLECFHSHVPAELMRLLDGKDVMVGVIDVASDVIETPEEIAETIATALRYVPKERLFPCTNCGLAPMRRAVAEAKLAALAQGAALARERHGR